MPNDRRRAKAQPLSSVTSPPTAPKALRPGESLRPHVLREIVSSVTELVRYDAALAARPAPSPREHRELLLSVSVHAKVLAERVERLQAQLLLGEFHAAGDDLFGVLKPVARGLVVEVLQRQVDDLIAVRAKPAARPHSDPAEGRVIVCVPDPSQLVEG